jgi:Ser-tRNA(Ala) deacylase AlaX
MTKKVFWEDPYLTELETCVTSVNGDDITVEQTIFYALAGGQESDEGTIGSQRVLQAQGRDSDCVYAGERTWFTDGRSGADDD